MDETSKDKTDSAISAQLAENIALVDREIRDSYSAADVDDIRPIAARDFAAIGHDLSEEDLEAYSESVANGTEYSFDTP